MKKLKRSARLVEMTQYLLSRPHTVIPLTTFAERYGAAKSSISEDLAIIKEVFEEGGSGELHTLAGAAGGVKWIPKVSRELALAFAERLSTQLAQPDRILPGEYLYMSDLLGKPALMNEAGKIFATAFGNMDIDVVMTVETKGIPLAYATGAQLNLPVVLVRRDHQATEGSAVSINYVSGSHKSLHTMSLSRRAMREHSRVLIVDDFMKAGGTVQGMIDLLAEFNATVAGVGVLVESGSVDSEERLLTDYISLAKLTAVDAKSRHISVKPGNYFDL
ncbi:pur operon repressor [Paenibacillus sp. UMB7766-LJ446]|uniref:Pur operon repressor n=1 Tax=Paenibacillus vandeheii TaxID=3035917 RepID=A0ABT8JJW0_9BACL|nr:MULTISPECIES: pur operon repressor [Paenibacillus]OPG97837.1 pur operon repressor [Chryseobacterium mucoviscidosis]KGP78329.1 purine operon repressor [Paenibacillus sp. MAEPY2]KGP82075.1 purine operon repressor [Paenibacillus sp. MAEPY1]MDK8194521.1 pur operon repressor [Paenibacillus sp. UMB7766-LJ446]MDN4605438.1 pur operon repressor [Paenibacillus vandeheii]